MANNTITNFIPDIYQAMDTVAREQAGLIPAVTLDAQAARAALGQVVRSHVAPANAGEAIAPGINPPAAVDQVIGSKILTIDTAWAVPFHWEGEQELALNSSTGAANFRVDQIAQAIRTLVNKIEGSLGDLVVGFSRATGTANTTPFASTLADSAQARKILVDNGAPDADLQLVINTTAGAALRTLATLNSAADAGTIALRQQGILLPLHGMSVRESAFIKSPAIGSVSGTITSATRALGATSILTTADYSSTLVAGDVITFATDGNMYIIDSVSASAITIQKPGLRSIISNGATRAITVVAKSSRNMAFHRSAIVLALRTPALPAAGDSASDRTVLTDPRTGLSFEFAMYPQYRRVRFEVSAVWGMALMKNEFTAVVLGEA